VPASLPTNAQVASSLDLLADLLEIDGAVRHRVLAYRRGASRVRGADRSVAELARAGRAVELPDIGPTLQAKIVELADTGEIAALEKLKARLPEGLAAVAALTGIGPKRALALWQELGVGDLEQLAAAVGDGRVQAVPGFGEKTATMLADQLSRPRESLGRTRVSLGRALPVAERLARDLAAAPGVERVEIVGGLRRGAELVHDIDLAGATTRPQELARALCEHPAVERVVSRGRDRTAVETHGGVVVELRASAPESFGNLVQHLTGSAAHNTRLRELARRQGLSVSEHGITRDDDGSRAVHATEDEVYRALGLAPIPPELREDVDEIALAAADRLPRLVEAGDLRGDLHVHSDWSDGVDDIEAMVAAAEERGYAYVGISDHSKSLAFAGGLDRDRLMRQGELIAEVRERHPGIVVARSSEVDILGDGRLDLDDRTLGELDFAVASIHSGFAQDGERLTARLIAAAEHPGIDAIGHPTGRMLGRREQAPIDLAAVVEACARTATALEVNGQPRRLDLDSAMARTAREGGARLLLSSDAHNTEALGLVRYAVLVARRAGATPDDVLNARPFDELAAIRAGRAGG
jgi:DNA polymerase (family 10)